MNNQPNETITISITGSLSIGRHELEQIVTRCFQAQAYSAGLASVKPKPMGLTVKQAPEELGACLDTVYRLLKRGPLRSSSALRHKVIPRSEIERFLRETTSPSLPELED